MVKLYAHPRGKWAKKHQKKNYYFGRWEDPAGALAEYRQRWPIITGQKPAVEVLHGGVLVVDVVAAWKVAMNARKTQGRITPKTLRGYENLANKMVAFLGGSKLVEAITPSDFAAMLATIDGIHNQKSFVNVVRSIFTWAVDESHMILRRPSYGGVFEIPTARQFRAHRAQMDARVMAPDDVQRLLDVTKRDPKFHAMVWLSINAAYGCDDHAGLPRSALKKDAVEFPRPKTGIYRIAWLWPETREAIARLPADSPFVFGKTIYRHTFIMWEALFRVAGCPDKRIYDLRRTFATVAAEWPDAEARKLVMGHSIGLIDETYIWRVMVGRVRALCEHVRSWLLGTSPAILPFHAQSPPTGPSAPVAEAQAILPAPRRRKS